MITEGKNVEKAATGEGGERVTRKGAFEYNEYIIEYTYCPSPVCRRSLHLAALCVSELRMETAVPFSYSEVEE